MSAGEGTAAEGIAPAVSVVIPTYRRPALLRRCLRALLQQGAAARPYEVIVVDDGHDEATRETVEALRRELLVGDGDPDGDAGGVSLRYARPAAGRGPAVARNTGWRLARAPLVAFTDDDTVPAPGWLAAGRAAMDRHPEWSAASGRVRVPRSGDGPPTDHERMTQGLEAAEFVTANAFVRRDALVRVDGFDERFERAWREDSDLQFRLARDAGPVGRVAAAEVLHPVRPERWGVSLRQQRNTFFDALLYKKHPRLYRSRIRPVPPWDYYAIVAGVAAGAGLLATGHGRAGGGALGLAAVLVARLAWRRLAPTSRQPAHVLEMIVTSALIPFLSVYWRLRGAWRFRVLFL